MFRTWNVLYTGALLDTEICRECRHNVLNPLKPNDLYRGRTAPLTSKRSILYTYSKNIATEHFKHGT